MRVLPTLLAGFLHIICVAPRSLSAERQCARTAMAPPYAPLLRPNPTPRSYAPILHANLGPGKRGTYGMQRTNKPVTGFSIPKIMHTARTIWTYNCQRMNSTHKKEWDQMLGERNDIWLMQGTQATYTSNSGEKPLQKSSTENYDIHESKAVRRKGREDNSLAHQKGSQFGHPKATRQS